MTIAVLQEIEAVKQRGRDYTAANPPQVGSLITIHYQGFYHASCTITKITEKAYQVKGGELGRRGKTYTVWFPKSALDIEGYPSSEGHCYGADIKTWFYKSMTDWHERLVGSLE